MSENKLQDTDKLFYSISEVSEMFDLNPSTLRFWEKEFEVLKPGKNKKGNRSFTRKDIENISRIVDLVKQKGFTLQGAKEQMKTRSKKNDTPGNHEVISRLNAIRHQLIMMRDSLEG
jgi:DNA-binding transcriptional MerR regulator